MGWEPKRWTVTDEDGAQVAITEPEWDDYERDKMIALDLYDEQVCSGCGVHKARMRKGIDFYTFDTGKCPTCEGSDRFHRHLHAQDHAHEKALPESLNEAARAALPHPADGRKVYLRSQTAAEAAQAPTRPGSSASPT